MNMNQSFTYQELKTIQYTPGELLRTAQNRPYYTNRTEETSPGSKLNGNCYENCY